MLRLMMRGLALLILVFLFIPAGFSKGLAPNTDKDAKNSDDTASSSAADSTTTTSSSSATAPEAGTSEAASPDASAAPAQNAAPDKNTHAVDYKPAPLFTPMLATTGTIGLFTLETADTLPKGGFAVSAFANKFGRMPGSVTVLEYGVDATYGITDRFNVYASFDPHGHVHIGCPGQLSLRSNPTSFGCAPFSPGVAIPGSAPGYVADYPFAENNTGGIGNVTLGVKYALLSERHGDPFSFSVRNDLIISTRTDVDKLLANGTQGSPLSDMVSLAVSKQWGNLFTGTFNFGYMFVRAPRDSQENILIAMPGQLRTGVGFQMFPESRFQPMMEYSAVVFADAPGTPPNNTVGATDPIDRIWGIRMYPWKHFGFDLGYRYMLNLRNLNDRSGFVIKVGAAFWPEKAPPVNHPPTISCTEDKSMVYFDSGDVVAITCTGAEHDNDPMTYTWYSTCGKVDGTGSQVRWLSAGVPVGSCSITSKVDDGRGGSASSSVSVSVEPSRIILRPSRARRTALRSSPVRKFTSLQMPAIRMAIRLHTPGPLMAARL